MVTNDERANRYGTPIAIGMANGIDEPTITRAVMRVADAELAELRAELEYPDLAYAVQKGGPNLDGPTVLTDEPTGDAMRWTKEDK
jgi:hypothetical protein